MSPPPPPEVSVVVPAWNAAGFIRPALRSVLDGTRLAVEVIVVDDCSTDDTAAVVAAIGDPRIRYERMAVNGGPSVARNRGFALAAAPWIAVVDSDDTIEPGRLDRMAARGAAEAADVVVDNLTVVRADGTEAPMFDPAAFGAMGRLGLPAFIRSNLLFRTEFNYGYLKPLFRTAFVRRHGLSYDPGIRIGEDYRFMAECLASGAVCAVEPTAGYRYFIRAGSISRVLTIADVQEIRRADRDFLARHTLDAESRKAQAVRDSNLDDAEGMLTVVRHLKARDPLGAMRTVVRTPGSVRLFGSPILGRLKKMTGRG